MSLKLSVNVDHIATIRQARLTEYPCPVEIALLCEEAGADGITVHLREDRRHIQDKDVINMAKAIRTPLNLEIANTPEMINIALKVKPATVCFVPEKREELTTEGGLDVVNHADEIAKSIHLLKENNIPVSLFVDPNLEQIRAAFNAKASIVELHTGDYAENPTDPVLLLKLKASADYAHSLGLQVNAGHGLTTQNVTPIAAIAPLSGLYIGHGIVARALNVGIIKAVQEMMDAMRGLK